MVMAGLDQAIPPAVPHDRDRRGKPGDDVGVGGASNMPSCGGASSRTLFGSVTPPFAVILAMISPGIVRQVFAEP